MCYPNWQSEVQLLFTLWLSVSHILASASSLDSLTAGKIELILDNDLPGVL